MNDHVDSAVAERRTQAERYYGKYRGSVSDNHDPLGQGRIQATVPELLGDVSTGWATPCAPYFGPSVGFMTVPPVGAGVWIEFEAGDLSRPIWTGGWWGSADVPVDPAGVPDGPDKKVLRSESLFVLLDDTGRKITISDENEANRVVIDTMSGTVTLKGSTRVVLESPQIKEGSASAAHPAVFGDNLLQYLNQIVTTFNTHLHPGELAAGVIPVTPAPPVAPFLPPAPSLLSMKVTLE